MENTVIVGEQQAGRAAKVRKELERLTKVVASSTFTMAELLSEVKHNGYYASNFESFKAYTNDLGLKTSKVQYLVRMVDVMKAVDIPREVYEPIGIVKMREITSLDPQGKWLNPQTNEFESLSDHIKSLVERAPELEVEELRNIVRILKGLVGENELVWMNICMKAATRDQVVLPAFELARRYIGSIGRDEDTGEAIEPGDGAALEVVAQEYLNDPANHVLTEE